MRRLSEKIRRFLELLNGLMKKNCVLYASLKLDARKLTL